MLKQQQTELIKRAQAGDLQARNELIEENMGLVHMALKKYLWPHEGPRSGWLGLGVEAFIRALSSYDLARRRELSTYVVPAIKFIVWQERHRLKSQRRRESDMPVPVWRLDASKHAVYGKDELNKLRASFGKLPTRLQHVLYGRMSGKTFEAIGNGLGLTRERIRQHEVKAHKELRRMMGVSAASAINPNPNPNS